MPRKLELPNLDNLIARYYAGESVQDLSREVGASEFGLHGVFKRAGVTFRSLKEVCAFRKRRELAALPIATEEIAARYLAGESLLALSRTLGIGRNVLQKRLENTGVQIRGQSEAERLKWSGMDAGRRAAQVLAAHVARRGQTDSEATACARAVTRHERLIGCSPDEAPILAAIRFLGYAAEPQFPLNKYNLDIALHEHLVAVEIEDTWPKGNAPGEVRNRTKYILDQGWAVVFVVGIPIDAAHVADNVVAFADAVRRFESLRGKYWVVGGNPKRKPRGSSKLDGLPRVEGLRRTDKHSLDFVPWE